MRSLLRLVAVLLVAILAALGWASAPISAAPLVPASAHGCTYDGSVYDAPGNDSVQERGPPSVAVAHSNHDAVGICVPLQEFRTGLVVLGLGQSVRGSRLGVHTLSPSCWL